MRGVLCADGRAGVSGAAAALRVFAGPRGGAFLTLAAAWKAGPGAAAVTATTAAVALCVTDGALHAGLALAAAGLAAGFWHPGAGV